MVINARARGRPRSFHDRSTNSVIRSLDRGIELLKVVSSGNGMSLTEIASAADQPASSAYRILLTLQKHGVVEFSENEQLWHVGLAAFRIGSTFLARTHIVERSRPVMQHLMAATGETANLAIVDHNEVIFINQVETHEPIRAFFRPGTRGPIHASGAGKALMAHYPLERITEILGAGLERFTHKTLTEPETLLREMGRIRMLGWAVDDEERTIGMRCVAAPVFNQSRDAIASLSLSGPSVRVTSDRDQEYGEMLRAAADAVTAAIGGTRPGTSDHA